jgi:hypothetical protein
MVSGGHHYFAAHLRMEALALLPSLEMTGP